MPLRMVTWTDRDGRMWRRGLPEGAPDSQAQQGIPFGPPSLKTLGLPKATEIALHNQLFARALFTQEEARRNLQAVQTAIASALKLDVNTVLLVYEGAEHDNSAE